MIKVLQILEATVGGTRRHLISLIEGLDRSQFVVGVAAPPVRFSTKDDTRFIDDVQQTETSIYYVDMHREIRPFSDLKALIKLVQIIRSEQYDLVHTHSSKAGFLGRFAGKLCGVPVIYTPNGFYFLDSRSSLKGKIFQYLEKFAGTITDCLIAVSESEKQSALDHHIIDEDRIIVIPNGIDVNTFSRDREAGVCIRQELGIGLETAVIGTVSRYIPQKDPLTLIRTASIVLTQEPETVFIWCGEGDMRAETEQLAQDLGIHASFYFLGFREDVIDIMNSFDIFFLSSVFEGLPYTLLESMSLELPVVATDVVGSRDVVIDGKTGFLSSTGNPAILAENLLSLLRSPEQRKLMGQAGRNRVTACFDVSQMVLKNENVYKSLTNIDI